MFAVVAVVAVVGSVVVARMMGTSANEGVVITPHIKGNPDAAVTLVEYSDFQCPACGQFEPIVSAVMEQYGDQLSLEYKHFPLISIHPYAVPAARAAEAAAQQGKFWEMHDKLFENQSVWANSSNPQSYFIVYAEELGLDVTLFKRHLRSAMINDAVGAAFDEARTLGLTGTPSFFLNGERFEFATLEDFTSGIEAALGITADDATTTAAVTVEPEIQFGI